VPQIAAETVSKTYGDPLLAKLMAVNYLAFRRRRSLLLLNLEHQVGVGELPWVRAVADQRSPGLPTDQALIALRRLGQLVVDSFPGTIVPNLLVRELDLLARESTLGIPFVEELAADIFMGVFTAKFVRAAHVAGELLQGSLYERYYGIDYEVVLRMSREETKIRASEGFSKLCEQRANAPSRRSSVSANGMIIEQAQILTTHNLATLAGPVGLLDPLSHAWPSYASRSFDRFVELLARTRVNPRPLATVKDAAYAWRQMVFYLSLVPYSDLQTFVSSCGARLGEMPADIGRRAAPAVTGLQWVADGGRFEDRGVPADARRLLGWSAGRHWILSDTPAVGR
jgi:hypothetical protein